MALQPSTAGSLDPQAVALAKAIRQTESGGNFSASGKSGEYGAYQYTEPTWAKDSAAAGVNVPLKQATRDQQNQVAYTKIKQWKEAGNNPGQIASMWNAGEGEPDAYTGKFSNGKPSVGTNSYGVRYDVPAYAKSVATAYQTLKQGGQVGADPNNPSSTAASATSEQTPAQQDDLLNNPITRTIENLFPGKVTGEAIGTLGGLGFEKLKGLFGGQDNSKYYDTSAPSPLQVAGDIAQGALMIGTGLPEAGAASEIGGALLGGAKGIPTATSALGRIGTTAAVGGGLGLTGSLAQGDTNLGDIVGKTATGAVTGGLLGGAGELVGKAADYLPQRIVRKFIPGINGETAQYAANKGLGSPTKMLEESNSSLNELGDSLDASLTNPKLANIIVPKEEIYNGVAEQFPNANLGEEELTASLKRLVPLQTKLVDKLNSGTITLKELNQLKSSIGEATYKTVFDDPAVRAGKQVGNAVYQSIKKYITGVAPETSQTFEDFTRELQLNAALQKAIRSGDKAKNIGLKEIVSIMSGLGIAGPIGGVGGYLAEKALANPTVNLKTAGLIGSFGGQTAQQLGRGLLAPTMRNVSQ